MRRLAVLALVITSLIPSPVDAQDTETDTKPLIAHPVEGTEPRIPDVTAAAWILWDDSLGIVLASHDEDVQRPMASTTKMMTGLVAIESGMMGQMIEVSELAAGVGEAEIDLVAGEVIPFDVVLEATLVRSGNDGALALAEGSAGSVEAFVEKMNVKAQELGLENTYFKTPHGLDRSGQYSSPRDLLNLGRAFMENETLAEIVKKDLVVLPPDPNTGKPREAHNTNELMGEYPGMIGVKTGYTNGAGLCLVAAAERNGRRIYAVVMGSEGIQGHFRDAEVLLDYAFNDFGVFQMVQQGVTLVTIRTAGTELPVISGETVSAFSHVNTNPDDLIDFSVVDDAPVITLVDHTTELEPFSEPDLPGLGNAFGWWPKIVEWFS